MVSKSKLAVLRQKRDFVELRYQGRVRRPCSWLLLSYKRNDLGRLRCGWTIPRQVAKAVLRNRLKRWCREFFTEKSQMAACSIDLNVVFRKKNEDFYKNLSRDELRKALERGWRRIAESA